MYVYGVILMFKLFEHTRSIAQSDIDESEVIHESMELPMATLNKLEVSLVA